MLVSFVLRNMSKSTNFAVPKYDLLAGKLSDF